MGRNFCTTSAFFGGKGKFVNFFESGDELFEVVQHKFNFQHAAISRDDSKRLLDWAFWRDFQVNGPSLYRSARTLLAGWKLYQEWPDARVRERFACEMHRLSGVYSSALWARERQFRKVDGKVSVRIGALREEFRRESGPVSRMMPALLGPVLLWTTRREDKRLAQGKTYEPPTIIERRYRAEKLGSGGRILRLPDPSAVERVRLKFSQGCRWGQMLATGYPVFRAVSRSRISRSPWRIC